VRFISVAVPVPFLDQLTYRVPDDVDRPIRGARVIVPLGSRFVTGIVTAADANALDARVDARNVKDIVDLLDDRAFLPESVIDLALWVAEYYACGAGDAVASAMPPRSRDRASADKTTRMAAITLLGRDAIEKEISPPLGAKQRQALSGLSGAPEGLTLRALAERGIMAATLMRLAQRGFVAVRRERVERDPFVGLEPHFPTPSGHP